MEKKQSKQDNASLIDGNSSSTSFLHDSSTRTLVVSFSVIVIMLFAFGMTYVYQNKPQEVPLSQQDQLPLAGVEQSEQSIPDDQFFLRGMLIPDMNGR